MLLGNFDALYLGLVSQKEFAVGKSHGAYEPGRIRPRLTWGIGL
jgi:hypothetical protein